MTTVNVHEAKTHLSRLLARAAAGEQVTIARAGVPIARLVPIDAAPARPSRIGFMHIEVPDDFDRMGGDELIDAFEGADEVAP